MSNIEAATISNERLVNVPDLASPLCHQLASTAIDGGFQSIIIFAKKKRYSEMAGLPADSTFSDNTCFLQTTEPYQTFVKQRDAPRGHFLNVSVQNYLSMYSFFHAKWPLVCSKLMSNANAMIEGSGWISLATNLSFAEHGKSVYTCTLATDLHLEAIVYSREVSDKTKIFLEVKISKGSLSMQLPLTTVTKLFSDASAYHAIQERYKGSP